MRKEEGEVLTYAALMEDLEVDLGSNTRGLRGSCVFGTEVRFAGGPPDQVSLGALHLRVWTFGSGTWCDGRGKSGACHPSPPPSIGGFVSRARNRKHKGIIDGEPRGTTTPEIRWIVKGVGVPNKFDPRTGVGWLLVWICLKKRTLACVWKR